MHAAVTCTVASIPYGLRATRNGMLAGLIFRSVALICTTPHWHTMPCSSLFGVCLEGVWRAQDWVRDQQAAQRRGD